MKTSLFIDICRNEYFSLIEMLNVAIDKCPDNLWNKKIDEPPFWQQVYHTVYYLDFYLGDNPNIFEKKFTIEENLNKKFDEFLIKKELKEYLVFIKKKVNKILDNLDENKLTGENLYYWTGPTLAHRLIYNVRHVQHHIGRLNSILRRHANDTSKWVVTSK